MAKFNLLKFLSKAKLRSDTICMTDLKYNKTKLKSKKIKDLSELEIDEYEYITPALSINIDNPPQIPIIGIGGCGVRIADEIGNRLKKYDIDFPVMGIETDESELNLHQNISSKLLLGDNKTGTGKQYRIAATLVNESKAILTESITQYLAEVPQVYNHEIVFLILGSGGTGVGVGIEVAKLLIEMGKRPVPFLVLPGKEENTRIKFNAAAGLYTFTYGPKNYCQKLTTICIDNEYFFEKNNHSSYANVIAAINERIGAIIGDLLISTEVDSDGYSSDLNEFLEIFRNIKSIGTLIYMHANDTNQDIQSFFESKQSISTTSSVDVYSGTRAYMYLQTTTEQVTASDYRSLMLKFNNIDLFPKFREEENEDNNYDIRAVVTGLKLSQYIEELMQIAQDSRVEVLNEELSRAGKGKINPKIERLKGDEEIDVKTGEELTKERSEEYAKLRSEGDIS